MDQYVRVYVSFRANAASLLVAPMQVLGTVEYVGSVNLPDLFPGRMV